ncbi:MAG: four helix bundle protein [Patescibacteria group bacterium]|nr:four helix bundle protein [Patescibacteria group bacterium]
MQIQNKKYDLEDRTKKFAVDVRCYLKKLPKTVSNIEDGKQVVRSSGSVGANYIEANEALSKKDFIMRIKISRKEAKESKYWLQIIIANNDIVFTEEGKVLANEAEELKKIFCSILEKSK